MQSVLFIAWRDAQRTYELDEVNETLRDMEGHHGVLICTTDWLDSLGAAAALHCAALPSRSSLCF